VKDLSTESILAPITSAINAFVINRVESIINSVVFFGNILLYRFHLEHFDKIMNQSYKNKSVNQEVNN
jgi:hypothetical protein